MLNKCKWYDRSALQLKLIDRHPLFMYAMFQNYFQPLLEHLAPSRATSRSREFKNFNENATTLHFITPNGHEQRFFRQPLTFSTVSFFDFLHRTLPINSFQCENDSPLGAGEHSFLIYGGQHLTLFNVDGQLHKTAWNTNIHDSIKQIRWSSYYRAYLLMTARTFCLFTLFAYELFPIKRSFKTHEQLQFFACYQIDLWLVNYSTQERRQTLAHYDLSDWTRDHTKTIRFSLDKLSLHRTDSICALECDQNGQYLALLVAERNRNVTVGVQRRRRLILLAIRDMSLQRTIYFGGADDLYWSMTSVISRDSSKSGWLLGKWFNRELTFVENNNSHTTTGSEYSKELRNLAVTVNGQYLALRTVDSLDIYPMY